MLDNMNRGVKRADKITMDELIVKVDVKESFTYKLVRSRLTRGGHVARMRYEKLAKRWDAQKVEGKGGEEERGCEWSTALIN